MAKIENKYNINSIFFILLSSDFYNIFSKNTLNKINKIKSLGHNIGLHFDETKYKYNNIQEFKEFVYREIDLMNKILGFRIKFVSMHRPSNFVLKNNIQFDNVINSYSNIFFNKFKYLSDSRMKWKEDVLKIVKNNKFRKLQILIHPIWYSKNKKDKKQIFTEFILESKNNIYEQLKNNISEFENILKKEEIKKL